MITIEHELDNPFSQDFYDKVIDSIQFHQLKCSCGRCSCLARHGSVGDGQFRLRVCRLRCSECGHTHALMLSCIVPYSQILLNDTVYRFLQMTVWLCFMLTTTVSGIMSRRTPISAFA